jgi:G3E family GTPase
VRHFPSPDIGTFARRLRHARGHRIPVTVVSGPVAAAQAPGAIVVTDTFDADEAPLAGGCACCTVRVELQRSLRRLQAERERGRAQFSRIVIAARGDLGPILRTFATERALGDDFFVEEEPEIGGDLERFTLTRDMPLIWDAFSRFIAALTALRGTDLTRTEGLLYVAGCRGPVMVHYRQHLALQPVELTAWPDEDRRSRITFVARNVERQAVENLFAAVHALAREGGAQAK